MSRAAALALAALLLAAPAAAQERIAPGTRYTPDPSWFRGPAIFTPTQGRVRVVSAPQGRAALTLGQYWEYEGFYRAAMARFSFSMPVAQAEPRARSAALAAILARHPTRRVAVLPLDPIVGPDLGDVSIP